MVIVARVIVSFLLVVGFSLLVGINSWLFSLTVMLEHASRERLMDKSIDNFAVIIGVSMFVLMFTLNLVLSVVAWCKTD
jgi:hypothetical protein